jgi:hypothetical protein
VSVRDHRRTSETLQSRPRDTDPYYLKSSNSSIDRSDEIAVIEVETEALRARRQRQVGRFLKGPISLSHIALAARLPGAALPVYLAIHHRIALTRAPTVSLPKSLLRELGVAKDAKARALHQLESAGLIHVERRHGRPAVVTLNTPASGDQNDRNSSTKA